MLNFKKDKILLLKEIKSLIIQTINNAAINPLLEEEVSELLTEVKDKRRLRKLKLIRNELDKFIVEMTTQKKSIDMEKSRDKTNTN